MLLLAVSGKMAAQETTYPFARGEPIGLVFTNVYTGINQGDNPAGFALKRAYLGYQFDLDKHFRAKLQLDIGNPSDVSQDTLLRRFAYFKDAWLQYSVGKWAFNIGIIPLQQFSLQEWVWGHRYIAKSALDEFGLASSADLGASAKYNPTEWLALDFTLMNGEGFNNLQSDNSFKTGLGITLKPYKGLIIRSYADIINKKNTELLLVNFVGYEIKDKFLFGAEYDIMRNEDFIEDHHERVFSAYATYHVNSKFEFFGRYDLRRSNTPPGDTQPWSITGDGSTLIAGIEYRPISKVRTALSYQEWFPYAANLDNEAFLYLNIEFRVW